MAAFPYIVQGTLFNTDGVTAIANVRVYLRNERTNETINQNTIAGGLFALDCANFPSAYAESDIVTLFVIYQNLEDSEEHTIVQDQGGVTINLTLVLVPASDTLRYFTVQDFFDFHHLTPGAADVPLTKEVVMIGTQAEEEIDRICSTRFSDGNIEVEVNNCNATTGWSGSTDATAIAVTTTTADYRTPTGALDLGKSGVTEAFFHYQNSTLTARDFRNRYVAFWVSLNATTTLRADNNGSAITVHYGSSTANYYAKSWYEDELIAGWNLLFFRISDDFVTTTGSPDPSACTYFRIRFDNTAITDVVTTGNFIIDNIFLAHEDHFIDEYMDTRDDWQLDYYVRKTPINRLVRFMVDRADEGNAPAWDELVEGDDEIVVEKSVGRIRLVDLSSVLVTFTRILPQQGAQKARATYIYGRTNVPKDVWKLAILMTARDLMYSTVSKAIMRGQDSFKTEHYTALDRQIDSILSHYRRLDILNS